MQTEETPIPGLKVLIPRRFEDSRGWFSEVWNAKTLAAAGIDCDFVQDNHSRSEALGTIRGLHYQAPPHAQAKLVRCGAGRVWDIAVDVRKGSPSYGQWYGVELSAENGRQLFIPVGFLHGFSTLTEGAELLYKCSDFFSPEADGSVNWQSAELGIDWKVDAEPKLSNKDAAAPDFSDWQSPFSWSDT